VETEDARDLAEALERQLPVRLDEPRDDTGTESALVAISVGVRPRVMMIDRTVVREPVEG
jgi:hypothetical protein